MNPRRRSTAEIGKMIARIDSTAGEILARIGSDNKSRAELINKGQSRITVGYSPKELLSLKKDKLITSEELTVLEQRYYLAKALA